MANILIIEDDPLMVRMYERAFQFAGLTPKLALNGEEGLNILKDMSPKPDLVLCDIMMPKMNGLEVLQTMKADEALKAIPVIMLTNISSGTKTAEEAVAAGALTYLVKSEYGPKEIVDKVKSTLEELGAAKA